MTGLGNDRAARIWYRALTVYLTSMSGYAEAREGAIRAAKDLYGPGSDAEQAVWNAFHGINVGDPWGGPGGHTLAAAITRPGANVALPSGQAQTFVGAAKDSEPDAACTYEWSFGDGARAAGPRATHAFTNLGDTDAAYAVLLKVTDSQGAVGTASRTVTVAPEPLPGQDLMRNGGFEQGKAGWAGNTEVIGSFPEEPPFAGSHDAVLGGAAASGPQLLYQTVTIPAAVTAARLSFHLKVKGIDLLGVPTDFLEIQVLDAKGELLGGVASFTNEQAHRRYSRQTFDLSAYRGHTVRLAFKATVNWLLPATFVLDEVRLMAS
jgi:hypothetical protein